MDWRITISADEKKRRKKGKKKEKKIGVAGLRSPCLPHAKGVLYQVSYNPNYIFSFSFIKIKLDGSSSFLFFFDFVSPRSSKKLMAVTEVVEYFETGKKERDGIKILLDSQ